jgi:hypothetical protein
LFFGGFAPRVERLGPIFLLYIPLEVLATLCSIFSVGPARHHGKLYCTFGGTTLWLSMYSRTSFNE